MNFKIVPTDISHSEDICKLRWNDTTRLNLHNCKNFSIQQCQNWINNLGSNSERWSVFHNGVFCGLVRVDNINYLDRHCSVGLDIVPNFRGKGYAVPIYKQIFKELFEYYNMNLLWGEVIVTNEIAINLNKKIGFQIEGKLRNRIYRCGKYLDCLIMSISYDDWKKVHGDY
jgi:diamine N-acetyltransferase